MNLQPVIVCGGSGARVWPLSQEHYPKQLLAPLGEDTLLQARSRRMGRSPILLMDRKRLAPSWCAARTDDSLALSSCGRRA